jgi:SET domain-containing protein
MVSLKAICVGRSEIHWWGIFADEPIWAGKSVVEYIGERVRKQLLTSANNSTRAAQTTD